MANVDKINWSEDVKKATQELIENYDNKKECWKFVDKLRQVLGIKNFVVGQKNDDVYCATLTNE